MMILSWRSPWSFLFCMAEHALSYFIWKAASLAVRSPKRTAISPNIKPTIKAPIRSDTTTSTTYLVVAGRRSLLSKNRRPV